MYFGRKDAQTFGVSRNEQRKINGRYIIAMKEHKCGYDKTANFRSDKYDEKEYTKLNCH